MSPQTSEDDLAKAFVGEEVATSDKLTSEPIEDNLVSNGVGTEKPKPKKKLKKSVKVGILIGVWFLLLGGAVGLGFLLRPTVEKDVTEEAFKWTESEREPAELVDVDFYAFYDTNAIEFCYPWKYGGDNYEEGMSRVPQISGLKNADVQNKVNVRIEEAARGLLSDGHRYVNAHIGDNMFNVLSIELHAYGNQNDEEKYTGLNFDLVTGDELSFDDIFVKGANVEGLVYKRFYSQLSSDYAFDLLDVERGIEGKEAGNCTMYCDPSVSLEEYRARKSEIEMKIANIEEIAMMETKQYLAGERKFYLESAGPVFIFDDSRRETRRYFTSDDIRYMAYLGKYRTQESIYVDDSVGLKNVFLSSVNTGEFDFVWVEENDEYLIDYMVEDREGTIDRKKTIEYLRSMIEKVLSQSDRSKYYYIMSAATIDVLGDRAYERINTGINVYEMDREYYESEFRKVVFNAKTRRTSGVAESPNPGPYIYDENRVIYKTGTDYGFPQDVYLGKDGNLYETADSLFETDVKERYVAVRGGFYRLASATEKDWKELLIDYYYANAYRWEVGKWVRIEYTNEEKEKHEFEFELGWDGVSVKLKGGGSDGADWTVNVEFTAIPNEYLKEVFRH